MRGRQQRLRQIGVFVDGPAEYKFGMVRVVKSAATSIASFVSEA